MQAIRIVMASKIAGVDPDKITERLRETYGVKRLQLSATKAASSGFNAVGFEVFMTSTQQETRDTMQQLCRGDYGIIFITEQAYAQVPEIIDAYKEQPIPAIIPIPGKDGSLGIGIQNVKKNVERAVGADILFNED